MDKRRLVLGLGAVLLVTGALLAGFTPGGLFNAGGSATIGTPLGPFTVPGAKKSSAGPVIGYVLMGVGALGLVAAFAMKPPPRA
jgi:hypothetical protein